MQRNPDIADIQRQASAAFASQLLPLQVLKAAVPFSTGHIYRLMNAGEFPRPIKLGKRRVAWRSSDISAWIAQREQMAA